MPASDPIATLIARAMLDGGLLQLRTRVQAKIDELEASVGYAVGEPTPETAGQEQAKSLTAKHRNAISKGQKSRWKKQRQPHFFAAVSPVLLPADLRAAKLMKPFTFSPILEKIFTLCFQRFDTHEAMRPIPTLLL